MAEQAVLVVRVDWKSLLPWFIMFFVGFLVVLSGAFLTVSHAVVRTDGITCKVIRADK